MKLLTPEWVTPDFDESISFELRGMNGLEYLEYSSLNRNTKEDLAAGKIAFSPEQAKVALRAVSGWRGFADASDEPVPFSQAALQMKTDLQTMAWLLTTIVERSVVSADTTKN